MCLKRMRGDLNTREKCINRFDFNLISFYRQDSRKNYMEFLVKLSSQIVNILL